MCIYPVRQKRKWQVLVCDAMKLLIQLCNEQTNYCCNLKSAILTAYDHNFHRKSAFSLLGLHIRGQAIDFFSSAMGCEEMMISSLLRAKVHCMSR